jgi:hypothetical protein
MPGVDQGATRTRAEVTMKRRVPFFIDLSKENVFCSSCRKRCRSLPLKDYTLFWCPTKSCENTKEVRLYRDGIWKVFGVSEHLGHNRISAITERLIKSIGEKLRKPGPG